MIRATDKMFGPLTPKRVLIQPWLFRLRVRNLKDIERFSALKRARVLTFDVFDTALSRIVAKPTDALALAAWRFERKNKSETGFKALLEARLSAEVEARSRALSEGRHEVTLEEIYDCLPGRLLPIASGLRAEELSTERDVCCANPIALAIFRKIVALGIPVAFISDTYLSAEFVSELLASAGYGGSHPIFASSAFGATKSRGDLFRLVAQRLDVPPSKIWHVGDNLRSDVVQARKSGFNALWFRPPVRHLFSASNEATPGDERAISRSLVAGISKLLSADSEVNEPWRDIGVSIAGPLYLAFAQWLIGKLDECTPRRIYFFSRDGKIIQQVYDRICRKYPRAPESRYLMVSRRSLSFPGIDRIDGLALNVLCGSTVIMPVEEYLSRIDIDPAACSKEMSEVGIRPGTSIDSDNLRERLQNLFRSIEPKILQVAERERALLARYLEQEGCFELDEFALCDIGWWGSLQRSLAPILLKRNPNVQIRGYYVGTHKGKNADFGGKAFGWLIDADVPEGPRRTIQSGIALIELLFTAAHGSVIGYAERHDGFVARLESLDQDADYANAAQNVQRAALDFVDAYIRACGDLAPLEIDRDDAFAALARLIDGPTATEASALGDLVMVEGMGTRQYGQPMARPPSLWHTLTRPTSLIERYRRSQWRHGFLVRFFGVPGIVAAAIKLRRRLEPRTKYA
jgi:predicted HAD superfamily hydrolase